MTNYMNTSIRIKKGDQIKVLSGKDRGKTGTVLKVLPDQNRITVEGLNVFKKRVRPKKQGQSGEVVMLPRPLAASSIMLVCKNCKKASRVGYRLEGERKVRYCKKCDAAN